MRLRDGFGGGDRHEIARLAIVIVTLTRSIAGYRSKDCINSGATDTKTGTRAVTVIIKLRAKPLLGTGDNQGKSVGLGH